ncbi:MAG: HAMP domain-containing histidine kinase [Lachnospira sp.]|nr:HAMP domain-containing histidine kinase [Lachnospira sp.]
MTENEYFLCLSRLSHDLNNCLSITRSSMQMVEMENPSLTNDAMWQFSKDGIDDMVNILERFSHYRYGNKLSMSVVSFEKLFGDISSKISKTISPDCTDFEGDETKLKEAFLHIIENALENGSDIIKLNADYTQGHHIVTISDNGSIAPENIKDSLFEPFVTSKEAHHGLGLAIAKRIIEAHGGSIEYVRENDWNCFRVIL